MGFPSQQITIVGNLVEDPELRYTSAGHAVANIRVVVSDRVYDKVTNEWKDGEPWFVSCSIWRDYAEHVAESLTKGARVVVTGHIVQRQYTTKEGEKRTVIDLAADEIAASMKWATVKVQKMDRSGGSGKASGSSASKEPAMAADDPWADRPAGGFAEEPPF